MYMVSGHLVGTHYDGSFGHAPERYVVTIEDASDCVEARAKARQMFRHAGRQLVSVDQVEEFQCSGGSASPDVDVSGLKRPWHEANWLAIDTETTGFDPINGHIIEVGWAIRRPGDKKFSNTGSTLVGAPIDELDDEVIDVTGIHLEDLEGKPSIEEVYQKYLCDLFDEADVMLAHNAGFDAAFLGNDLKRPQWAMAPPLVCSLVAAESILDPHDSLNLESLASRFGADPGEAHRAGSDARACGNVFLECARRTKFMRELPALGEVVKAFDECYPSEPITMLGEPF